MAPRTPLEQAPDTVRSGRTVFLKREDRHALGAFKWRGALPAVEAFRARGAAGVITASTGNHGAAVAWAAQQRDLPATVYAPLEASRRSSRSSRATAPGRKSDRETWKALAGGPEDALENGPRLREDGARARAI
jgi:threonine dehydratase